jgi:hypothetical protein
MRCSVRPSKDVAGMLRTSHPVLRLLGAVVGGPAERDGLPGPAVGKSPPPIPVHGPDSLRSDRATESPPRARPDSGACIAVSSSGPGAQPVPESRAPVRRASPGVNRRCAAGSGDHAPHVTRCPARSTRRAEWRSTRAPPIRRCWLFEADPETSNQRAARPSRGSPSDCG